MAEQKNPQAQPELSLSEQTRIRREKLTNLQAEGQNPFVITRFDWDATSQQIKDNFDAMEGKPVKVAGRLMSKRGMGKVSFCDLQDRDGRIQLYARQDEMDEEVYKKFKKFDIGDIVGVEGEAFRTQRGEMSVRAHNITLLSKSLLPLPEKFHGLQDKELRFRQRYVDLMVNPEVKKNFVIRSQFIKFMRNYLDNMGYMEVETPVLNTIAGGAAARPFITHHNTLDIDMYMRIATELPLKRLIVGGMDRVYEIGRIFRNEGMDPKHNPEFTTVEMYQAYADFHTMMDIAEGILAGAAKEINGSYQVEWMGEQIDHLFIPALRLAFLTDNRWHPVQLPGVQAVRCTRFVDRENLAGYRARLRFNERAAAELLEQAADLMAQAKACHDELETYYRAAVDFGKVDEAAAQCAGMLGLA